MRAYHSNWLYFVHTRRYNSFFLFLKVRLHDASGSILGDYCYPWIFTEEQLSIQIMAKAAIRMITTEYMHCIVLITYGNVWLVTEYGADVDTLLPTDYLLMTSSTSSLSQQTSTYLFLSLLFGFFLQIYAHPQRGTYIDS
jgi:hypothetical protein